MRHNFSLRRTEPWVYCVAGIFPTGAAPFALTGAGFLLIPFNFRIHFSALSAASLFFLFLTTTADTAIPTKYNPTIGAMKINIVVASGVGVITAATTAIIKIA